MLQRYVSKQHTPGLWVVQAEQFHYLMMSGDSASVNGTVGLSSNSGNDHPALIMYLYKHLLDAVLLDNKQRNEHEVADKYLQIYKL